MDGPEKEANLFGGLCAVIMALNYRPNEWTLFHQLARGRVPHLFSLAELSSAKGALTLAEVPGMPEVRGGSCQRLTKARQRQRALMERDENS